MFTNKKVIRYGLWVFITLCIIEFTISCVQQYYKSTTGNELVISETWRAILLDAPENILVILGAISLYQFTKKSTEKNTSI
ncbi:hypothetical protein CN941_29615 [Bacillus cereus]|uniref:DUF3937 family protein n=1 Tax=Bacillus nitratireducens TaxID=2026193 RepID=UPI000BECFAA6|nr:DUF3937 family protein [Bacillus nitratireducens]PEA21136.1 hypothetical protein CON40_10170 [Bacillus cereus]PET94600.1 hypothetical protein CN527_26840 [Bacillus cereus]PEW01688.1 hypothetical protein CN428_14690 [Bacillus cereus]PEZ87218.1 hypothetical protein CN374_18150 [Bacillus cereus]PFA24404.1 hypothetical protein CN390_29915 [Bacillus cereus]